MSRRAIRTTGSRWAASLKKNLPKNRRKTQALHRATQMKIPWESDRVQRDLVRLSSPAFAAKWDVSTAAVAQWRRRFGIPSPRHRTGSGAPAKPIPHDFPARWAEMTYLDLAAHYDVSSTTVNTWRTLLDLPRKSIKRLTLWRDAMQWAEENGVTAPVLARLLDAKYLTLLTVARREGFQLADGRKYNSGRPKQELRTLAYCVLRACGWRLDEIATAFGVTRQCVQQGADRHGALSDAARLHSRPKRRRKARRK